MLFTKKEIEKLIDEGKDIIYLQTYIGFEETLQGYCYKSYEAWESDNPDVIVYSPEYCYEIGNDEDGVEITTLNICSCYTKKDFLAITNNNLSEAEALFEAVDWQHPTSLWNEWDFDEK